MHCKMLLIDGRLFSLINRSHGYFRYVKQFLEVLWSMKKVDGDFGRLLGVHRIQFDKAKEVVQRSF